MRDLHDNLLARQHADSTWSDDTQPEDPVDDSDNQGSTSHENDPWNDGWSLPPPQPKSPPSPPSGSGPSSSSGGVLPLTLAGKHHSAHADPLFWEGGGQAVPCADAEFVG